MAETKETSLAPAITTALVPANSQVQAIAKRFRWSEEKTIQRIQTALPAPVEQQVYLQLGGDFRIQPESMAKLLREFLGDRQLIAADLANHSIGHNLISSRFSEVADFLQRVFSLISKDVGLAISMRTAAKLVIAYGDGAELLVDEALANSEELARKFRLKFSDSYRIAGWVMTFLVEKILPKCAEAGRPNPGTIAEALEELDYTDRLRLMTDGDCW